jgi:hypothetical protein
VLSTPISLRNNQYLNGAALESYIRVSAMIGMAETLLNISRLGELLKSEFQRLERILD